MSPPLSQQLTKLEGYIELRLFTEATAILESLQESVRATPPVLSLEIALCIAEQRYNRGLFLAHTLCEKSPNLHIGFIHGAYCLHELGRTDEALAYLQAGPESLQKEPTYFYNLACYQATLGNREMAISWLRQAIQLDQNFHSLALKDPDLRSIRDSL